MPTFEEVKGTDIWFPKGNVVCIKSAPGGLTSIVTATTLNEKGPCLVQFEAKGRCAVLGAAIDAGAPTEVGQ